MEQVHSFMASGGYPSEKSLVLAPGKYHLIATRDASPHSAPPPSVDDAGVLILDPSGAVIRQGTGDFEITRPLGEDEFFTVKFDASPRIVELWRE